MRYSARSNGGYGWYIWDTKTKRSIGHFNSRRTAELLAADLSYQDILFPEPNQPRMPRVRRTQPEGETKK